MSSYTKQHLMDFLSMALEERVLETDQSIGPDARLEEVGLDSLRLTQLLLEIEEETGVWIDEQHLTEENLRDVRSLAECLLEVLQERE